MKQITKIGGSLGFRREERQWRNLVHKLQRKKYQLRESWIVADIQENMYRQKLTDSLRERGIDYQAICEQQRIQQIKLRKRTGRSGRASNAKKSKRVQSPYSCDTCETTNPDLPTCKRMLNESN